MQTANKMDTFEKAFRYTILNEISGDKITDNNQFDSGGFTYYGIARNIWPQWKGWSIVEDDIRRYGRARKMSENLELEKAVKDFYFINFWKANALEKVAFLSPSIAVEVFDTAVNGGGTVLLQKTLNVMNRRGTLWKDIAVDGVIGPITIETLATALRKRSERLIYRVLNAYQGKRYIDLMEGNPAKYEEFIGWFERLSFDLPILKEN